MEKLENQLDKDFVLSGDLTKQMLKTASEGFVGKLNYLLWRMTGCFYAPSEHGRFERAPLSYMRKRFGDDIMGQISMFSEDTYHQGKREAILPRDFMSDEEYPESKEVSERIYNELSQYVERNRGKIFTRRIGRLNLDSEGNIVISEIPGPPEVPKIR